jgi:hypothetical protein
VRNEVLPALLNILVLLDKIEVLTLLQKCGGRMWVWTTTASFQILAGPWFTTATLTI